MEDIAVRIARLMLAIRQCVPYCISRKKHKYYYKQYMKNNKRVQERIPPDELEQTLKAYQQKKKLKAQLHTLKSQVEKGERQTVRSRVQFYLDFGLPVDPTNNAEIYTERKNNIYLDGTPRRSKTEIIISLLLLLLNIPCQYEPCWEVPGYGFCLPDFVLPDMTVWEHLGMMNNEQYRRDQERKLEMYAQLHYEKSTNLLLTGEQHNRDAHSSYIDLRDFIKKLVEFNLISVRKARKFLKKT